MKRYERYKPSGIPWIGEIPEHWEIKRLKFLGDIRYGLGTLPKLKPEGLRLIRATDIQRGRVVDTEVVFVDPDDVPYERDPVLREDDIVVVRSGAYTGDSAIILQEYEGSVVGYDMVLRATQVNAWFISYCLLSHYVLCKQIYRHRLRAAQPHVNREELGETLILMPEDAEQITIAEYLRAKTAQIDDLISKKQQLINLLNEEKTAIINHAVTKGLNPNAPMKDSGIPWLGKVPGHWEVKRLKFVSTLQTGLTLGKKYSDQKLVSRPYLRVANVQDGYLDLDVITEIALPPADVRRYELEPGDVVMTEGGDFDKLGRGYVWENQIPGCLHQNHIFAVRPKQTELNPHFLSVMLTSSHGKNYFTSTSQQTTNLATTNRTKLLSFPVPLPPLDEQEAIVGRLSNSLGQLEALVAKVGSIIEQLREYRTTLISAAVTGKIDVSEHDSLAARPY